MNIAFFDTHNFEKTYFSNLKVDFFSTRLSEQTVHLAQGYEVICVFVNDHLSQSVLEKLNLFGVKFILMRCAGYNNVNIEAAKKLGIKISRVPEYSPHAVAEHALALILTLNRKTHKAYNRTRDNNFLLDGLVGFDLYKKTVGVIGTGRIGSVFCKIMLGLGCKVIAYDLDQKSDLKNLGVEFCDLKTIFRSSDIVSLHVPLNQSTHHLINEDVFKITKPNLMLINTSRGALIETQSLIHALKNNKIHSAGLDVYEEEEGIFFEDLSNEGIKDDLLARLTTFPNVLITSHQGFLTHEALTNIAQTTEENLKAFLSGTQKNIVC